MKAGCCENTNIVEDDTTGQLVCASCGLVKEEAPLVNDVQFANTQPLTKHLALDKWKLFNNFFGLFNLTKPVQRLLIARGTLILDQYQAGERRGLEYLGALLYLTAREQRIAISLTSIMTKVEISQSKLLKLANKVQLLIGVHGQRLDPERFFGQLCESIGDEGEKAETLAVSLASLNYLEHQTFPEASAVAYVAVVLEGLNGAKLSADRVLKLCQVVGANPSTANSRIKLVHAKLRPNSAKKVGKLYYLGLLKTIQTLLV